MKYIYLITLGVIAALYILLNMYNAAILGTEGLNKIHFLVKLIAPPNDLYKPLISSEISIANSSGTYKYSYNNKYTGMYDVGIILDKFQNKLQFVSKEKRYKLKLKLELKFVSNNKVFLHKITDENYSPFSSASGSGFALTSYKCPLDLPVNQIITCEVKVIDTDEVLSKEYGPVKFYIQKLPDR